MEKIYKVSEIGDDIDYGCQTQEEFKNEETFFSNLEEASEYIKKRLPNYCRETPIVEIYENDGESVFVKYTEINEIKLGLTYIIDEGINGPSCQPEHQIIWYFRVKEIEIL